MELKPLVQQRIELRIARDDIAEERRQRHIIISQRSGCDGREKLVGIFVKLSVKSSHDGQCQNAPP